MRLTILAIPLLLALAACDPKPAPTSTMTASPAPLAADEARDPICKMPVKKEKAQHKTTHEKTDYYFCAEGCLKRFQADPAKYAPR